jgi:hypothetical protein
LLPSDTGAGGSPAEALPDDLALLAPLSQQERTLVAACFEPVEFEYGETVVAEGEAATAYYVITSGRARCWTAIFCVCTRRSRGCRKIA